MRHGIGVHHAGMLPKYRRLVERLAQAGLLKVICGTDTLGVGINVPIRTVLLTGLSKYDGTKVRHLTAREFHQISGRAGRAGFDTAGSVVVQAPEHVVENHRAEQKAAAKSATDGKTRKLVKKKPPDGFVSWGQPTFERLVASEPETLGSSFRVSNTDAPPVLDRDGDGCGAMKTLLLDNHEPRDRQRMHIRRAIAMYRALLAAGVVERLDEPDDRGRLVRVTVDLQADFALNQPLAPFALAALDLLDPDADTHRPRRGVGARGRARGSPACARRPGQRGQGRALVAELKAAGVEYEERMERLAEVTAPPAPRRAARARLRHLRPQPPLGRSTTRWAPKSVVRDLWERAMTFADYVQHYQLARSEGLLLRYLSDAYKAHGADGARGGEVRGLPRPHRVAR